MNSAKQASSCSPQAESCAATAIGAAARVAEDVEAAAYPDERGADRVDDSRDPPGAALADEQRSEDDREQQRQRRQADDEQLLRARVEELGRADDDRAEEDERGDVEDALRDERSEQDGERLPHPPGASGEHRGAGRLAEAGRQRRRHQHADHRRRGDVAAAQRAARAAPSARSSTRRAARRKSEAIIRPVATSSQVASERTILSTTSSTPIRCAAMKVRPTPIDRGEPDADPPRGPMPGAAAGRRRVERGETAGRARRRAVDRDDARTAQAALDQPGGRRLLLDALVRRLDALGDPRPREPLGGAPGLGAEARQPLRAEAEVAELLGEPLRVGGRDEDPVDAVGDDVVVAGDVRRDDRRPGGERLGQDHAEALAGERRGAEDVGVVERAARAPRARPGRGRRSARRTRGRRGSGRGRGRRRRSASAAPGRARPAPGRRRATQEGPCVLRAGRRRGS